MSSEGQMEKRQLILPDFHDTLVLLLYLEVTLFKFIQKLTLKASSPPSRCCKIHRRLIFMLYFSDPPFKNNSLKSHRSYKDIRSLYSKSTAY